MQRSMADCFSTEERAPGHTQLEAGSLILINMSRAMAGRSMATFDQALDDHQDEMLMH